MNKTLLAQQGKMASVLPPAQGILRRQCACGNHTMGGGQCADCAKKKNGLQRKLAIGASNDPLEQEADRVADQVLAAPAHSSVSGMPPRIQRYAGQTTEGRDTAPASVDHVLSKSGRPLEPALQQDMEQRFAYDFSRVRVHSDPVAEESAQEVNAHAYTVGQNIVFGAGRFAPGTHEGRRLIAHELTHVVQQRSGGEPRLRRQTAPDVNKSAKFIEDTYRSGARQLSDPTLSEAASEVRRCREAGGYYCEILVTTDDINSKYADWTLIDEVLGSRIANQAIVDHKLNEVAQQAANTFKKQQAAMSGQPGQYGVAMGGLVALAPAPVSVPVPVPVPVPPVAPVTVPGSFLGGTAANSNVALAAGPKPIPVAAAGVAIIVVVGIIVTVQLWKLGQFQRKLWDAGYKYLPSPRGVCMRGCHQGSQNLPRTFDVPDPDLLVPLKPRFGPRSGPLNPTEIDEITKFLEPQPWPESQPREKRRARCKEMPGFPRGGNVEHDALALHVTGRPFEYIVTTPEGATKQFDGKDLIGTLYDVKTRHDFLRILGRPDVALTFPGVQAMSSGVARLRAETSYELQVAERCGYEFHIATNNLQVVQTMREILGDIMDRDDIEYVHFPWPP